jgi:hypothetical protein
MQPKDKCKENVYCFIHLCKSDADTCIKTRGIRILGLPNHYRGTGAQQATSSAIPSATDQRFVALLFVYEAL